MENAQIGLERFGGKPACLQEFNIQSGIARVGMLESTRHHRNKLLRAGDLASMAHSLELRKLFVDSTLLYELARFTPSFPKGLGKQILASSALKPLPKSIINRPKSGFSVPHTKWIINNKIWQDMRFKNYRSIIFLA